MRHLFAFLINLSFVFFFSKIIQLGREQHFKNEDLLSKIHDDKVGFHSSLEVVDISDSSKKISWYEPEDVVKEKWTFICSVKCDLPVWDVILHRKEQIMNFLYHAGLWFYIWGFFFRALLSHYCVTVYNILLNR